MTRTRAEATASDVGLLPLVAAGASSLGVVLNPTQLDRLVAYVRLIERWNATYNLTAIRDPCAMATHHIVDSLAVIRPLREALAGRADPRVLDVGSGAGLPGVVIAIAEPGVTVTCVDSVGKKAAFIQHVAADLNLSPRLSVVHARVEQMPASLTYNAIVSRAFASLPDFVASTRHLLAPEGRWLAMKGKIPYPEIDVANELGADFVSEPIIVPSLDADRCVLIGRVHSRSEP